MDKNVAMDWLTIASHDLKSAQILFEADHYTDSIGTDLQQAIEKILKSILAFNKQKVPKTHDLYQLYDLLDYLVLEENEIDYLYRATEYYKEDRYPNPNYCLPAREEIKEIMVFTEVLFLKVCDLLEIDPKGIK
jgi:HEPN domain-containing protein